jgi:GNAT superfamily N-acetyltransferase
MTLDKAGFTLRFEEIEPGNDSFGCAAIIPWDSDIFGFRVAQYRIGSDAVDESQVADLSERLFSWLHRNDALLCSCTLPAANAFWKQRLPGLGFDWVDLTLRGNLDDLQNAALRPTRITLRLAEPGDAAAIEAIAEQGFHHGRYHADPWFPNELADRRYRRWVANALAGSDPRDQLYVMGEPGNVKGFYHVTLEDGTSDLRLAAVVPTLQGKGIGSDLYAAILHLLKHLGVRRIVSSISATNAPVINIHSMLGCRLSKPETVYHWHSPAWPQQLRAERCLP